MSDHRANCIDILLLRLQDAVEDLSNERVVAQEVNSLDAFGLTNLHLDYFLQKRDQVKVNALLLA